MQKTVTANLAPAPAGARMMSTQNKQPETAVATPEVAQSESQPQSETQSLHVVIETRYQLEAIASKDPTRGALQNIKLDVSKRFGQCAVATDGKAMAIVPVQVKSGENDRGLVSPAALKESHKAKASGELIFNGNITLPLTGETFERPTEQDAGNYPRWEMVLPDKKPTFAIGLNPQLLLDLAKAIGAKEGVTLRFIDELSPISVTRNHDSKGEYGVLMPMRIGG